MKVLILTPDIFTRGGIARYTATLASALGELIGAENVHVLPLLALGGGGASSTRYRTLKPLTSRLTASSKFRFTAKALGLGFRKYDLIVCTHIGLAPVAGLMHLSFRTPFWVICHGREAWPRFSADVRWAMERTDVVLPISRFTAEMVSKVNGIPQSKMRVLYNAIPDDLAGMLISWNGTSKAAVSDGGKGRCILSVGMVSSENAYKGYDTVIRALPHVLRSIPDAHYQIVGEGDDSERLKRLTAEMGVESHVEFKGGVSDVELAACYRTCSVFVLPSRTACYKGGWLGEGFGRVYVEASLAGKPVIGSCDGGAAEAVLHERTGLLVSPGSVPDVANALIKLLRDPALAARMGCEGQRWAVENFTSAALRSQLQALLNLHAFRLQYQIQNQAGNRPHGAPCKSGRPQG